MRNSPKLPPAVLAHLTPELHSIAAWVDDDDVCHDGRSRDVLRFLLRSLAAAAQSDFEL